MFSPFLNEIPDLFQRDMYSLIKEKNSLIRVSNGNEAIGLRKYERIIFFFIWTGVYLDIIEACGD